MKIIKVDIERVEQSIWGTFWEIQRGAPSASPMSQYDHYADSLESWSWPQATVLVRIESDSGHSGIGWAEDGVGAASCIIERHLKRFVLGADPSRTQLLWDQMFRASIPYGRKGAAIEAISALDLALWDLAGKIANKPVYSLLGGPCRRSVPAYASHLQPVEMEKFVEEAAAYAAEGYRAMKMRMPGSPKQGSAGIRSNVDRVRAVREAIGYDIDLMVDAYMGWDLSFAIHMAKALEPYQIRWIEEPLLPDEIESYAELRRRSGIAIATGEHEFTRFGFQQLIVRKAADILQPDVHRAGGLTEMHRIATLAEAAGLEVVPHGFSGPAVHFAAAHSNCPLLESLTTPVWASHLPSRDPLLLGESEVIAGEVALPEAPGLGVSINTNRLPDLSNWNEGMTPGERIESATKHDRTNEPCLVANVGVEHCKRSEP